MERKCGECFECCHILQIEEGEFFKPGYTTCQYINKNKDIERCSIYDTRPTPCKMFLCSWKRGFGSDNNRPDKTGILVGISEFNNGTWIFVIERWEDAVITTGKDMVITMASMLDVPVIISKYGSTPPVDQGDWVIAKESLKHRCTTMIGDLITYLDDEKIYGLYNLRK